MPRVAVVTGGTRGIGGIVSTQLKAKGYKVAAVYGGNTDAAKKFGDDTGIAPRLRRRKHSNASEHSEQSEANTPYGLAIS
ncbi:MAG: hypothetical protein VYE62_06455, partial [Pseudomonadota bacterium]|nr:hypothetical protein [Pseudomonadota bacterium]